jgi:hypothetical protein
VGEAPFGGGQWIELALPGAGAHITLVNWFPQMPPGSLQGMVFETPDVQEAYQACLSAGVDVSAVESASWGAFFTFRDPDGNGFVVQETPGAGGA